MEVIQMLFNEIYSAYYKALAVLINRAIDGKLNSGNAYDFINTEAFRESFVYILDAIQKEQWQVITKDFKTPIKNYTRMPLTTLQKQFLKSISLDKRFALFIDGKIDGLDGIEPLYEERDFYSFDLINDGDPYESKEYITVFKIVLRALKEKRKLHVTYIDRKGNHQRKICIPRRLEYSEKDDKFRLFCLGVRKLSTINLARIKSCELLDEFDQKAVKPLMRNKENIILEITDERNALERCMLHFSNYEKVTTQLDKKHFEMKLTYYKSDETELLIRVLSFGPLVKVKSPEQFINMLKDRLNRQIGLTKKVIPK
jgi:hypothetical protein